MRRVPGLSSDDPPSYTGTAPGPRTEDALSGDALIADATEAAVVALR